MLEIRTRTFIADLWFVFAMLTPVFTPILLVGAVPDGLKGGPLFELARAMLSGPLSSWFLTFGYPVDFTMVCALPTLFVAAHALALRLVAHASVQEARRAWGQTRRFMSALMVMGGAHMLATLAALCVYGWRLPDPCSLGLWGGTLILYVVVASMWCVSRRSRAHSFEMLFGLILTEHLAWPMLGYLFSALSFE